MDMSMPMDVWCGDDIDMCKTKPTCRWKIFGWGQDSTYLLQQGASFWIKLDEFELMLQYVRPHDANIDVGNLQFCDNGLSIKLFCGEKIWLIHLRM